MGFIHLIAKTKKTVETKKTIANFKIHLKMLKILFLNVIFFDDDFFAIKVKLTHPNPLLKREGLLHFFPPSLFKRRGWGMSSNVNNVINIFYRIIPLYGTGSYPLPPQG